MKAEVNYYYSEGCLYAFNATQTCQSTAVILHLDKTCGCEPRVMQYFRVDFYTSYLSIGGYCNSIGIVKGLHATPMS